MATIDSAFQSAWLPLTPRGVARFASTSAGRVCIVQSVFALLAAAVLTWFVRAAWLPTVEAAIEQLPAVGEIRAGQLYWVQESPQKLAEGRFLSIAVDLTHSGETRGPAHMQVEFGRGSVDVCAMLGCVSLPYPLDLVYALNRSEARPWWGAWRPVILVCVFCGMALWLMIVWDVLAALYCVPARIASLATNRSLTLLGAWRLCAAAQLPGVLFLSLALVVYALGFMDPVRLLVAFVVHWVLGWFYIGFSLMTLERVRQDSLGNPFASEDWTRQMAQSGSDSSRSDRS